MADEHHNEQAKVLEAKLAELDLAALQNLLQTAIAKKTKESSQHGSPVAPSSTPVELVQNNEVSEDGNEQIESDDASIVEAVDGYEQVAVSSTALSNDPTNEETIPSNSLADNLQSTTSEVDSNQQVVIPEVAPNSSVEQASETNHAGLISCDDYDNITGNSDEVNNISADPEYNISETYESPPIAQFTAPNQSSNSVDQNTTEHDLNLTSEQQNIVQEKLLPINEITAPSNLPSQSCDQHTGQDLVLITRQSTPLNDSSPVEQHETPSNELLCRSEIDVKITPGSSDEQNLQSSNGLPANQYNPPSNQALSSAIPIIPDESTKPNSPEKQAIEPNKTLPSSNQVSSTVGEHELKLNHETPKTQTEESFPAKLRNSFLSLMNPVNDERRISSDRVTAANSGLNANEMVAPNNHPVIIPYNFPSVVPPVLIPFSKIDQYLPEGMVVFSGETRVPLKMRPVIVVKDQIAAMVFENYDDSCKKCEKVAEQLQVNSLVNMKKCQPLEEREISQEFNEQPLLDEQSNSSNEIFQPDEQIDLKTSGRAQYKRELQRELQQEKEKTRQQTNENFEQHARQQQQDNRQFPQVNSEPRREQETVQGQQQELKSEETQMQYAQPEQQEQHLNHQSFSQQESEQAVQSQQQQWNEQPQGSLQNFSPPLNTYQGPEQLTSQSSQQPLQQQHLLSHVTSFPQYQGPSTLQPGSTSSSLTHLPTNVPTSTQQTSVLPQDQTRSTSLPGLKPPTWMSDENCKNCGNCTRTFSVTRRKHHCRGCGKIFCSDCCNQLAQLPYLGKRIARICVTCTRSIRKAHSDKAKRKKEQRLRSNSQTSTTSQSSPSPALLYSREQSSAHAAPSGLSHAEPPRTSQISPLATNQGPTPRVNQGPTSGMSLASSSMVSPSIPEENFNVPQRTSEAYQGPVTPEGNFNPAMTTHSLPANSVQSPPSQVGNSSVGGRMSVGIESEFNRESLTDGDRIRNSWKIPSRPAGRTITWTSQDSEMTKDEQRKRFKNLHKALKTSEGAVIQVAIGLSVSAKKVQVVLRKALHEAWFLCSHGFASHGQCEIAFLLEKQIKEEVFPYEMLKVFRTLYSLILNQGELFEHGSYLTFNNSLLESEENAGFIFISLNKAPKLIQHHAAGKSLLFGILLKQSEIPYAKFLPTRLLNALGVQQQSFPSPAISSRDRSSVCRIEPNELFYSTFFAFNEFMNYKTPPALIPDVHILKSGSKVVLELPFSYQTEIIGILDDLLVDESQPVTLPIAGDLVPDASGHFVHPIGSMTSARRGFMVLQNSSEQVQPGNQYFAFSAILLVLTFGDACNSRTRFGIEVIEDGITVTLSDSQAREIRQAIYQGTNCAMSVGNSTDSKEQFTLRWTSDTCASILNVPTPVKVVQNVKKSSKGHIPTITTNQASPRSDVGQTNVVIERVKTRDIESAIQTKINSGEPQLIVNKLESDVRQACASCLLTFASRLRANAEKRLNLTLSVGPGNYKKWSLGPNNQPINLARALQLALNEIDVPNVNDQIVFVFNVILQKRA